MTIALGAIPAIAAEDKPAVVYLYPPGSPTLKGENEKEILTPPDPKPGDRYTIKNVHNPLIEVHLPPADKATGAAIVIAPGGGHRELFLNSIGVATFILKYRLAQTPNYPYTVEGEALQDTQRALRIVRSRASEWHIDPNRVGILGFSAGGALAALAEMRFDQGNPAAMDPIERVSDRPDFVGMVYAGWGPMNITIPKDAPPTFLTSAGSDDQSHAKQTVEFYNALFSAGIPAELHIYGHGGHGNGVRSRDGIPFGTWHYRFQEWMNDLGYLKR
jgi:acetyl esterase/lipase